MATKEQDKFEDVISGAIYTDRIGAMILELLHAVPGAKIVITLEDGKLNMVAMGKDDDEH